MYSHKKNSVVFGLLLVTGLVLSACQPQIVEVVKEVPVEQVVEVEVEKIVEVEVEVTAEVDEPEVYKIGMMGSGPVTDLGWNYQLDQGGKKIVEHFGGAVEYVMIENVPFSEEVIETIELLIAEGADMIIEGAYAPPFADVSIEAHPDVEFIVFGTLLEKPANVHWLWWNQGSYAYLLGMTAALLTETDSVGYITPFDIPLMRTQFNSFALGVQSVNPDIATTVIALNSWYDPAGARTAAEALVDAGIDVIGGDMDDPAKVAVAEERGVWVMGAYSNEQQAHGPTAWANTYVYDFGAMFIPLIEDAMSGNWKGNGELVFYNIGEGVDIGVWGENVPQDVVDQVEAVRAKMISGKLDPFVGPWVDKNGIEVLPAGETLTDWEWTLGADYVLAGIEGAVGE